MLAETSQGQGGALIDKLSRTLIRVIRRLGIRMRSSQVRDFQRQERRKISLYTFNDFGITRRRISRIESKKVQATAVEGIEKLWERLAAASEFEAAHPFKNRGGRMPVGCKCYYSAMTEQTA